MSFESFFGEPQFDYDLLRQKFIDNMDMLKGMSVQEQTLYKKWLEINSTYRWTVNKAGVVKAKIWRPTNIMDKELTIKEIGELNPTIRFIDPKDSQGSEEWLMLRIFVSSFNFDQNPGRFLRFVIESQDGRYLGLCSLGSDVTSIGCRDRWIGWTEEDRIEHRMLRHTAIGTTIVATQPFGYNFLGGKLVASLLATKAVSGTWETLYNDVLAGITTTSLYGGHSMYQRIPFWKELGKTTGKIPIKPDDDIYEQWHHWFQKTYPAEYAKMAWNKYGQPASGVKQKILNRIMRELKIKQSAYIHGFERGVYFAPLYENTREYLRREIDKSQLIPSQKLLRDKNAVIEWWTEKAIKRYINLYEQERLNDEVLFYNRLVGMEWPDVKKQYLDEVGR